jgi:hypothetical protein
MRNLLLPGAMALLVASGAPNAFARGGTGNLSPSESPYAILEPQTLTPGASPMDLNQAPPAQAVPTHPARPRKPARKRL